MSLWAALAVLLASGDLETRGQTGAPPLPPVEKGSRQRARVFTEASLAPAIAFTVPSPRIGLGPGLHLELGAVLSDRILLSVRVSAATIVVAGLLQAGFSLAFALNDQVALAFAATLAANTGLSAYYPSANSVQLPIRLTFMPRPRLPSEIARRGFLLGIELSPGIAYSLSNGLFNPEDKAPAASITAMISAGYAVW